MPSSHGVQNNLQEKGPPRGKCYYYSSFAPCFLQGTSFLEVSFISAIQEGVLRLVASSSIGWRFARVTFVFFRQLKRRGRSAARDHIQFFILLDLREFGGIKPGFDVPFHRFGLGPP